MRIIVGVVLGVVVVFGIGMWYAFGAPGAPASVKRTFAKLPLSGNRFVVSSDTTDNGGGLPFGAPATTQPASPFTGQPCADAKRRPIAVMQASDPVNRPNSGLSYADAVYEMPVLINDVTRLMAVYQCTHPANLEVGSVRSARHPFLPLVAGIDAVVVHWGGSYWALNLIANEGNIYNSISALGAGNGAFYRHANLPAPYNGFTTYDRVFEAIKKVGYRTYTVFTGYPHTDGAPPAQRGSGTLDIGWPGAMRTRYIYNPQENTYERTWGGVKDTDALNTQPLAPSVVVVVYTEVNLMKPGEPYVGVRVEGSGKAEIYQNGQQIAATWKKDSIRKEDPMHFLDASGSEIPFVRGQVWFAFVGTQTTVRWTPGLSAPAELNTGTTPANLDG